MKQRSLKTSQITCSSQSYLPHYTKHNKDRTLSPPPSFRSPPHHYWSGTVILRSCVSGFTFLKTNGFSSFKGPRSLLSAFLSLGQLLWKSLFSSGKSRLSLCRSHSFIWFLKWICRKYTLQMISGSFILGSIWICMTWSIFKAFQAPWPIARANLFSAFLLLSQSLEQSQNHPYLSVSC